MYVNLYKADAQSYTDKNFESIREAMNFLRVKDLPILKSDSKGIYSTEVGEWKFSIRNGEMPEEEGYVSMLEESGALDWERENTMSEYFSESY